MRRIAPFHGLTLIFLLGLIILTIFFRGQIPGWHFLLLHYLLGIGVVFALQLSFDRKMLGEIGNFIYYFSPLFFIIFIYQSFGDLIHHLQPDIDQWLIKIDYFIFDLHPVVWMERWISSWLTELMSFFYGSYYFLPFISILILYFKDKKEELNLSIFVLVFGYYLSFIGYILFPAIGPRYTQTDLFSKPLEGGIITDIVMGGLDIIAHNKRDVMPSGHTQISLIVLFLVYRYNRIIFYTYLPLVCGLILSTVYLRYHYVIDLFAGVAIAVGCMVTGPHLYRWCRKFCGREGMGG